MTIAQAATHFGVSEEYLRRRIAETGLTRRPGTFAPRSAWSPNVLQAKAVQLYATGMTMRQVGARLGVSSATISQALHAAKVPVRPGGGSRPEAHGAPRTLISDLYADPGIVAALRRRHVQVPDEADWQVTDAFHSNASLPVPATLLRQLYVDIDLSIHHIAMLIGVGDFATRGRLIQAGVPFRPSQLRCSWTAAAPPATVYDWVTKSGSTVMSSDLSSRGPNAELVASSRSQRAGPSIRSTRWTSVTGRFRCRIGGECARW